MEGEGGQWEGKETKSKGGAGTEGGGDWARGAIHCHREEKTVVFKVR